MTSYLAAVATRELGTQSVDGITGVPAVSAIAPRVASGYEPWSVSDGDYSRTSNPRDEASRAIEAMTVSTPDRKGGLVAASHETVFGAHPNRSLSPPVRVAVVEHDATVEHAHAARSERPSPQIERVIERASKESLPAPRRDERRPVAAREESRADSEQRPNEPPSIVERRTIIQPTSTQGIAPRAAMIVHVAAQRAELRREAPNIPAAAPSGTSEPAVIVTIGRIDVRAVNATPAARSAPVARDGRAMMSLDEYLQQRVRGAR